MCYELPSVYSVAVACVLICKYEHTIICMYAHVNVRSMNTCMHTQTYVHKLGICMLGCLDIGTYKHWHMCTFASRHAQLYVHITLRVHTSIITYVLRHISIHTHAFSCTNLVVVVLFTSTVKFGLSAPELVGELLRRRRIFLVQFFLE
jgi:hypothetical protein